MKDCGKLIGGGWIGRGLFATDDNLSIQLKRSRETLKFNGTLLWLETNFANNRMFCLLTKFYSTCGLLTAAKPSSVLTA